MKVYVAAASGLLATVIVPLGARAASPDTKSASVIVTRASSICFSSLVRTTGYLVPRSAAAVMFNAPGFKIKEVSVAAGDRVAEGQQVAVVAKDGPAGADAGPGGTIVLRAPVAGTILRANAKAGVATSPSSDPLFTIATGGEIEAMADIPSIHVQELNPGQTARVSLDDGREFGGHVRLVPAEINKTTQVGQARVSVENEPTLKTGTFVHVAIDANRSCGIAVPRTALTQGTSGISVQVVKDKTISTRTVKLGLLSDTDAEISEGVTEGDFVVANAGTSLRDGDKVNPIDSDLQEVR